MCMYIYTCIIVYSKLLYMHILTSHTAALSGGMSSDSEEELYTTQPDISSTNTAVKEENPVYHTDPKTEDDETPAAAAVAGSTSDSNTVGNEDYSTSELLSDTSEPDRSRASSMRETCRLVEGGGADQLDELGPRQRSRSEQVSSIWERSKRRGDSGSLDGAASRSLEQTNCISPKIQIGVFSSLQ